MSAMRTRILPAVCFLLLLVGGLSASPTCVLRGRVRDARTGEPLVGASVTVTGTECGNATDQNGDYMIVGLPAMTGTATAACIGYDDTSARFTTTAACTTHLDFGLRIPVVHLTHIPYPPRPEPSPRKSPPLPAGPRPIDLSMPAKGHLLPLPVGSHSRFEKSWGDLISISSTMAIEQAGDSALIQVFGSNFPYQPTEYQAGMREGRISASEFRTFWDSLAQLGFWQLKSEYEGRAEIEGEEGGSIWVNSEDSSGAKNSKTVRYDVPRSCSLEFRRVYDLFGCMAWFAQLVPDWKTLLSYDSAPPIPEFKAQYHSVTLRAIAAIRDSQDIDTLLTMLQAVDQYSGAVISALGNIDSSLAVATLEKLLARLEAAPLSVGRDSLALRASKILVQLDRRQGVPAVRHYLSAPHDRSLVTDWCTLLAGVGDYSVVPEVVGMLSDTSRYRGDNVRKAARALQQSGYRSRTVISALFREVEKEVTGVRRPDWGTAGTLLLAIDALTGQEFRYHLPDSPELNQSSVAEWLEWLKWWEANAKRFPVAPRSGLADAYGFIQVNSTPSVAAISLDSLSIGKATPFVMVKVPVGEHELWLTKDGYADWSSTVRVVRGETVTVAATLTRSFGGLNVSSTPSGAAVSLDGISSREVTPCLLAHVPTGRHDLGLTEYGYQGWDSIVTVTHGQTATARGTLKPPPESLWITYAGNGYGDIIQAGPERAVRFSAWSGFGYPLHIAKVKTAFYHWQGKPSSDSSFRLKIYRGDGKTLLYQSPGLEAVSGMPGPDIVHELSTPVLIDSGEFYVSVAPVDSSGLPPNFTQGIGPESEAPSGISSYGKGASAIRSYSGSPGHWSPLARGELAISVLVRR
jgi:hypothetical protein